MKITIIGATGGIGAQLLEQARAAGHDVTAVVRSPEKLASDVRGVGIDLSTPSPPGLADAVAGADAVLSALGARTDADAGISSRGTATIVAAMKESGARRLVVISAVPIGTVASPARPNPPRRDPGDSFFVANVLTPIVKRAFGKNYADLALMEDEVRASELDWTIVRPSRLTDKPRSGSYRTDAEKNLRGGTSVARADVADFMLEAAERPETIGQTVRVAS
jgi:putative NADH-flavin reductase